MDHWMGEWLYTTTSPLEVFTQRNFVTEFKFYLKNKNSLFEPPFGGFRGNIRAPSIARWKARVDFLFVIIELFRYLLRLKRYKRKSVEVGVLRRGGLQISQNRAQISDGRRHRPPTTVGARKLSCGTKISAVHCLILSQSTHVKDRRTDGRTEDRITTPKTALAQLRRAVKRRRKNSCKEMWTAVVGYSCRGRSRR